MPRRRPEFESGEASAEAAKLRKFSNVGGSQSLWLSDAAGGSLKECLVLWGKALAEPILQSRAVYQ